MHVAARLLARLVWILRVLAAAGIGWLLRRLRRVRGQPPRIWHGMLGLHLTGSMVRADRAAGYISRAVALHMNQSYTLVQKSDFDRVIQAEGNAWYDCRWLALIDLLWHGDVWVAYFDCLFFRADQERLNRLAFALIRLAGIKIIACPHGGDVNHQTRYQSRFNWIERYNKDYPSWDANEQRQTALQRIALFCRYSHFVIGGDSSLTKLLPRNDLAFKYFPVDCDPFTPQAQAANPRPIVAHAPNHRLTKGTNYLVDAAANLARRGIDFELMLVEGVARAEALQRYARADVIADQFCIGAFGMFGLEGLALGKPVLTYLDQEHLGDPVFNLPIVNTNPENIEKVLAVLLQVPPLRDRLGKAGRASVEQYQSVAALAEVWDRIYRHVWWGEPLDLEKTRHFSPERKPRSFTEDPALAEFWPVPVADLLAEIHAALRVAGFAIPATGQVSVEPEAVSCSISEQ